MAGWPGVAEEITSTWKLFIWSSWSSLIKARWEVTDAGKVREVKKTNFESYLEEQLKDPAFADRFEKAGEPWQVAMKIAALRQQVGVSHKDVARQLYHRDNSSAGLNRPPTKAIR